MEKWKMIIFLIKIQPLERDVIHIHQYKIFKEIMEIKVRNINQLIRKQILRRIGKDYIQFQLRILKNKSLLEGIKDQTQVY